MDEFLIWKLCQEYLSRSHELDIEVIKTSEDLTSRKAVVVDISELLDFSPIFISLLYSDPFSLINKLLKSFTELLCEFRAFIDIRLCNPPSPFIKPSIGSISSSDSNKIINISGTVILCGSVKSLALRKSFKCCVCGEEYLLEASLSLFNSFELPTSCSRPKCRSYSFAEVEGSEEWIDYREIKIYDAFTCSYRGRLPESLWVILTAEQVGMCSPGDDVSITGIIIQRWFPLIKNQLCDVQLALYSTDLQVYNSKLQRPSLEIVEIEKPIDFPLRSSMLTSFAPFIYGLDHLKLGLLLCILGGIREEVGTLHLRGHSHCLLLGEPGTGKSDLLRESCKLITRGIYTNAINASKAGLTLSAVKEGNDWMLEAGALVLADSGLCALDDLSFLNKEDLSEIYECMENQTISVAKAGMVCTVNTRTTIIAACRPKKNRFDFGQELNENANMPAPLLSRFDLIFLVVDLPDTEADKLKSNFVLNRKSENQGLSIGQLQYLIGKASKIKPKFSKITENLLNKYFEVLRKDMRKDVTMRQLESLLRLTQAHAKLCMREEVEIFDCVSVIMVYEASYRGVGITKSISFVDETIFQIGFNEILAALGSSFDIDDNIMANRKTNSAKNRINEEKFCIPKCIQGITLPRNLDLNSFVEARITELNHFLDVLEDKAKGRMSTKRNFQLLPKHMRRRAMSHNAHRIPARIRNTKQELAYLKNPCRKTRRHHSKLMQDYMKRNQKSMWLETHIWHAKRMKMIERWGYKLALHCNDKGLRASYRFARDSAIIYDQSYQIFSLIKNSSKFHENFGLKAKASFRLREKFIFKGEFVALIDLYPFNDDLIVSVHPAAYEKFCQVIGLQGIEILSFKDQVNWFSIRGPKSTDMVARSLDLKNDEVDRMLKDAGRFHGVKFPHGAIVYVEFIKNLHFSSSKDHLALRHSSDFIPLQPSLEMMKLSYNWPKTFYNPNFWQKFTPNLPVFYHVPEKLTTRSARSRYPKAKPSTQPNPNPNSKGQSVPDLTKPAATSSSANPENAEKKENPSKLGTSSISISSKLVQTGQASETIPMDIDSQYLQTSTGLLVYNESKYGGGWDLILPSEHTSCVFRSFVYSGCKAVGLEEFKLISYENGKAFFPDDYPTCAANEDLSTIQAKERIINYFKKPSGKRVNYERISSPFPFFSDWKLGKELNRSYSELVSVKVKSYKRCPKNLAYICKACPEDLITGKYKEPLSERSENNSKWKPETIYKLSEIKTTREIIGFVTTGGLSFRRCKGFGIGYIKSELSKELPCKGLFRNPNSQFYHLCDLKLNITN